MDFLTVILGGLGVFLLGMKLLSDNLRSAAGDALRMILAKFTGGKLSSVGTGTVFTALVQSSSATTLAAIGFVSAGLLTFSQAVGVIFGANLGTTATSWLVATLGLRVSISAFAYPMVGIGALVTLLTKGRKSHFGAALAGFGLIFVGIDILQLGMADLADEIDLTAVDGEGLTGQLILIGIGFVMTVLMQSSSAAVATTLTALFAGAVDLPQAASLVIGQAVGTTVTAALAAIGASLAARRTAVAHILFNVITAVLALSVLPLFLMAHGAWVGGGRPLADATAIAIFHTAFKLLGVVVLLPVLEPFSRAVYKLVPGEEPQYAAGLDDNAAAVPAVGVEATRQALLQIYDGLLDMVEKVVQPGEEATRFNQIELDAIDLGLLRCREFLDRVQTDPDQHKDHRRHLNVLHALDHLERLHGRLASAPRSFRRLSGTQRLVDVVEVLDRLAVNAAGLADGSQSVEALQNEADRLTDAVQQLRHQLLQSSTTGEPSPGELDDLLEAIKWSDRVGYHLWRAGRYLAEPGTEDDAD